MIQDFLNIFFEISVIQWGIVGVFFVVFILRHLYLLLFTASVIYQKNNKSETESNTPISLVLTLRNEEKHVKKILPAILELKGIDFEVVVIDDFSQDNTLSVLGLLKQRYGRLKISSLSQETRYSVKLAQNIALKSASNNWVLCTPISLSEAKAEWLQGFSYKTKEPGVDIIMGYSTITPQKGFFNLLYRIENFYQHIKSAASVCNGVPVVYSEENLAFKKEKYFEIGGYGKNIQESYANLELVVNSFITKKNTVINFSPESIIRKNVEIRKLEYLDLLKKNYRIEKHLPSWKKMLINANTFTKLIYLPVVALSLFFVSDLWPLIILFVVIHALVYVLIIKISLNRLNERKIFISSLVYGLLMPYYKMFYSWHLNNKSRKKQWKLKV